jgi:FtsP/CotA-like multicopper oxidase with cupredoxin domain
MKPIIQSAISKTRLLLPAMAAVASLAATAHAAAPGITGAQGAPVFNLNAAPAYLTQPDGQAVYSWGYGCLGTQPGFAPMINGNPMAGATCPGMQVPGPTLIVTEGDTVTVNLTNSLPPAAGNTSILFSGFAVNGAAAPTQPASTCKATTAAAQAPQGLLTTEAANGCTVTYTFKATSPGTRAYYSGTQGDLQVEMGLYGAIIVLPANPVKGAACTNDLQDKNDAARSHWSESNFRLSTSAYDDPHTCYDREYLFQFSEMDPNIHTQAESQVGALVGCTAGSPGCSLNVPTEPYHPAYFMINGRSMPDDMDPNYAVQYPHQPYNGNPHMHPGEQVLLRIIGQGRWQHPFHEHANHVRILARDGNLVLTPDGQGLAGPALFTTTTTPGMAMDGIFYYTGRGLNWDMYGHNPNSPDPNAKLSCVADTNGYNTGDPTAINYYEWCQDHNKPLEAQPFGDVAGGGPATLPNPNILTNGAWYGGSPYLGPDATTRATFGTCTGSNNSTQCGTTGTTPPSGTIANNPSSEAGYAFMWHSHNEREITTNNIFPGGMMMMMLIDSREFLIDESN